MIKRHIAKTISWRLVGTIDTMILSWLISNNFSVGVKIGLVELVSKMVLYYMHERLWYRSKIKESNLRHIIKTFSWRIIGTIDTILLGWIFTGNPYIGVKIGLAEIITKMFLYYFHEKLWYNVNFGLNKKRSQQNNS